MLLLVLLVASYLIFPFSNPAQKDSNFPVEQNKAIPQIPPFPDKPSYVLENPPHKLHVPHSSNNDMLLLLSAPSIYSPYYKPAFDDIVEFQINYANEIMKYEDVIIMVDFGTLKYYSDRIPADNLYVTDLYDIWVRDFTTVNPYDPIQFTYTNASMTSSEAKQTQFIYDDSLNKTGFKREYTNYLLDGGNVVDNYEGRAVVTTRFLDDNYLTYDEGKKVLKELLHLDEVAIIIPDEDVLSHSDGMVMWIDSDTLLVNDYSEFGDEFRSEVLIELRESFPTVEIIEIPVEYTVNKRDEWVGFSSACGVNVNSVLTEKNLFVPVFGMDHDNEVLDIIREHTTRNVIPINAEGVCAMGGSVRCQTWQMAGENAEKIKEAARNG
ncbi:MAG: agmatine/peptidylarginine deiminase [Patescibacteria group bacterium]|jgi:agmatine/peptidylarginine deiminase